MGLQTVQKIGPVLDLFTTTRPEWGVTEVAAAIDVPRSSAHALLSSLVDTGLLRCRARGRYRLGWRVVELGETLRGTADMPSLAAATLQRLIDVHGETVHLAVLDRWDVLCVDKILGTQNITVQGAHIGARHDAHATAVGKVLLAHLSPSELNRYVALGTLRRHTAATITDPCVLTQALADVRTAGCAVAIGEAVPDVCCVAAPIRDDLGSVVAAVSLSVPATRFSTQRAQLQRAVIRAGQDITRAIIAAQDDCVVAATSPPVLTSVPAGTQAC